MITRIFTILIIVLLSNTANAALPLFNQKGFNQAVHGDKRVVLMIHEEWCGHCAIIQKTLSELRENEPFKSMVFYQIPQDIDATDIRFKHKKEINDKYVSVFVKKNKDKDTPWPCEFEHRSTLVIFYKNRVIACQSFQTHRDNIIKLLLSDG